MAEYTSCRECAKADPTLTYIPEDELWEMQARRLDRYLKSQVRPSVDRARYEQD